MLVLRTRFTAAILSSGLRLLRVTLRGRALRPLVGALPHRSCAVLEIRPSADKTRPRLSYEGSRERRRQVIMDPRHDGLSLARTVSGASFHRTYTSRLSPFLKFGLHVLYSLRRPGRRPWKRRTHGRRGQGIQDVRGGLCGVNRIPSRVGHESIAVPYIR